jgi:hypothetical protein
MTGPLFVDFIIIYLFIYLFIYVTCSISMIIQGGSNMTGTNCDLFTHK